MHEVSIALSLIGTVSEQCRKSGYRSIESINVRIGRASGIMPDALLFAFDAVKGDDALAKDAVLNIEEVPVAGHCRDCSKDFSIEEAFVFSCPVCGGSAFQVTSGREMDIIDMEVSE